MWPMFQLLSHGCLRIHTIHSTLKIFCLLTGTYWFYRRILLSCDKCFGLRWIFFVTVMRRNSVLTWTIFLFLGLKVGLRMFVWTWCSNLTNIQIVTLHVIFTLKLFIFTLKILAPSCYLWIWLIMRYILHLIAVRYSLPVLSASYL